MCCVSSRPMCVQLFPASVDLYIPLPKPTESRSVDSPLPTYTTSGAEGATAIAPIDATGCESKTGFHTRPASTVFHTPPFTAPTQNPLGRPATPLTAATRPPRKG